MPAYNPAMSVARRLAPAATLVGALFVGTHAAGSTPSTPAISGTTRQITQGTAAASQSTPAISGSLVVWTNTVVTAGTSNSDIWYQNIDGGSPTALTNTDKEQEFLEDIDGTTVVFSHTSAMSAGDILVQDLAAGGLPQAIVSAEPGLHYEQPSIHGRYIVFVKTAGSQVDIGGYNNDLGLRLPDITNDAAVQSRPRVSDDYVVYEDYSQGTSRPSVYGYQISTQGPAFPIAQGSATAAESMPDVDGTWVVWVETTNTGDQILAFDISSKTLKTLTTTASHKLMPRISGDRVVWADDRNGNWDVYTYSLTTSVEELLVGGAFDQMSVDIDANHVVYTDNTSGFESVWLYSITGSTTTANDKPVGCDPNKTDLADAAVTLQRTNKSQTVSASRTFSPVTGKQYYICVENGTPTGAAKTAQLMLVVDNDVALSPSDFKPNNDPPHYVATTILDGKGHGKTALPGTKHTWSASLYGNLVPATVTISLRVAK
jgi:beta propeller repeat protein